MEGKIKNNPKEEKKEKLEELDKALKGNMGIYY